jgi:hypothetical protein
MIEQRQETAPRPADHRPKAVWIDVADLLRDGAEAADSRARVEG